LHEECLENIIKLAKM